MPRYRVILEFDHPGDGIKTPNGDLTRSPDNWDWERIISDDATDISARVFVLEAWRELTLPKVA